MAGPDLTAARAQVASIFDCACTVTADDEGVTDDVLDLATLELTPPDDDTTTIYRGPCLVRPRSQANTEQGGGPVALATHQARLPVTATGVHVGHTLTVTRSPNDPTVLGAYTVITVAGGSFAVTRILGLSRRDPGVRT